MDRSIIDKSKEKGMWYLVNRTLIWIMGLGIVISLVNDLYFVIEDQEDCYRLFTDDETVNIVTFILIRCTSHFPVMVFCLHFFWVSTKPGEQESQSSRGLSILDSMISS